MRWCELTLVISVVLVQYVVWTESRAVTSDAPVGKEEIVFPRVYHMSRKKRDLKTSSDDSKLVIIKAENATYYLELYPNKNLISGDLDAYDHANPCLFQGKILSHTGGIAAISTCEGGGVMRGLLITPEKSLILQPVSSVFYSPHHELPPIERDSIAHVLFRAEGRSEEFCGTDHLGNRTHFYPHLIPEDENEISEASYRVKRSERNAYTIEAAVFVDKHLYRSYAKHSPSKTQSYATQMVYTIMNQVQLIYKYRSMRTNVNIAIVKLEFLQNNRDAPQSSDGNIDRYLDEFCTWQGKRSDRNWDHAILLTGLDLYKEQGNAQKNHKVLGLAWVNGMCRPKYSCTLNEGTNFEAGFVISHEMGHSLSMLHDGTGNSCDADKYIMSPKTGPGKTNWSPCSNKYIEEFIKSGYARCLENSGKPVSSDLDFRKSSSLPGQKFTVNEQCQLALGTDYKVYLKSSPPYNNVCRELWCVKGMWATSAHPALEGSNCGRGKQCVQGYCQANNPTVRSRGLAPTTPKPNWWDQMKEKAKELYGKAKNLFG
uniref:Putative metalloprotease n=1 Tax=Megacormus gertschi TaxID=1843536 RepID=A0A224XGC5_9SCOR